MSLSEESPTKDPYYREGLILLNKFRVERYINEGGMGAVYSAVDLETNELFAVKFLKPDLLAADPRYLEFFEKEVSVVQKFDHSNIVKIFGFGKTEDRIPFMIMEWLEGETLDDILDDTAKREKLDVDRISNIFEQVCNAISYAHGNNVLHLDIKPANIFLTENNGTKDVVKVIDFGLSRIISSDSGTTATRFAGTFMYCSPEHFWGKLSFQSDIYSLGITLYCLLNGKPSVGKNYIAAKQNPLHEIPALPSIAKTNTHLPSAIDEVIRKATRQKASERQNSVMQFWEDFREAKNSPSLDDMETVAWSKTEPARSGKTGKILILATLVMFVGLISSYYLYSYFNRRSPSDQNAAIITDNKPRMTIAAVFYDLSSSMSPEQRDRNMQDLASIVNTFSEGSEFRIYPINSRVDNSPIYVGSIKKEGDFDKSEAFKALKVKLQNLSEAELTVRKPSSCIISTIDTTKRYFKGFEDDAKYNREIIYFSDMIEHCDSSASLKMTAPVLAGLLPAAEQFNCGATILPLSRLTFIVSTSSTNESDVYKERRPRINNLDQVWQTIFRKCFADNGLRFDNNNFYFDNVLPERFRL
jgi:serine/threonine protein kinase